MKKILLAMAAASAIAMGAWAEKAQAGFYLDQNVQASYNPLGLQLVTKLFYRIPLVDHEGILWESTRIDAGFINYLSPAYGMPGVFVTIEPIAVCNLTLTAQAVGYYNILGFGFYDLSGYDAGFDSSSLSSLSSKNTAGFVLTAAPTLKAAFGPIAIQNTFSLYYFNVDGGSGYFYERYNNTALGKTDVELVNSAFLMYAIRRGLLAGLNDWLLFVPASGYVSHRLCAVGVYSGRVSETLSLYAALQLGPYFADRYLQYNVYVAGQAGIVAAIR